MNPVDVKPSMYIDFDKANKRKIPNSKIGDDVRISKYKNFFAKHYVPNWYEEFFLMKKIKNIVPWTCVISDLEGEEIVGNVLRKGIAKNNQKEFKFEKVIKRKGDKLYVKWKG